MLGRQGVVQMPKWAMQSCVVSNTKIELPSYSVAPPTLRMFVETLRMRTSCTVRSWRQALRLGSSH